MKIVINNDYGGFSVSKKVYDELGLKWNGYGYLENDDFEIESDNYYAYRADPRLIEAIEKIGEKEASGRVASLKVVEIPDGTDWEIDEYDGWESIHESHRVWS